MKCPKCGFIIVGTKGNKNDLHCASCNYRPKQKQSKDNKKDD